MKRSLFSLSALLVASQLFAAEFTFDQSSSSLEFSGDYEGEPIAGKFQRFSGKASLDLSSLRNPQFEVQIETKSLDTAYQERDDVLRDADWFASDKFPTANFRSTGACKAEESLLNCAGELTLRGVSKPVALQLSVDGKALGVVGTAKFKRKDFGVGQGEWDESVSIGDEVSVRFRLALKVVADK